MPHLEMELSEFLSNTPDLPFNALEVVELCTVSVPLVPNQESHLLSRYTQQTLLYYTYDCSSDPPYICPDSVESFLSAKKKKEVLLALNHTQA